MILQSPEAAVDAVVRAALGSRVRVRLNRWYAHAETYAVASVHTIRPVARLVVKVEIPGTRPNRHLDSMARIAEFVRERTDVPTFEVVSVDTTRARWPWEVLIVTELPGITWQHLYGRLTPAARAAGQFQIGRAAAQLHQLAFDHFGDIAADGSTIARGSAVEALRSRAERRIRTPHYRQRMLDVLETHAGRFATCTTPRLTHEDLNPFNLLFELNGDQPVLSGVLDFESAWSGVAESDTARLELWWFTRGAALREGYAEIRSLSDEYTAMRPVLQLLWCLEYADDHPTAEHQVDTNRVCAELGISPITFVT